MRFILLFITSLTFCLSACSQEDDAPISKKPSGMNIYPDSIVRKAKSLALTPEEYLEFPDSVKEQRQAVFILASYVTLKDYQYYLEISESEAEVLGVSAKCYQRALKDLMTSNRLIKESYERGDSIELLDIKKIAKEFYDSLRQDTIPNITNMERAGKQSGTISTNGNDFGSDNFYPTADKGRVKFVCRTRAVLAPYYVCKTYVFGTWNAETASGAFKTNTTIYVPLAASGANLCAELYFSTSDSWGGVAAWSAVAPS